MSCRCPRYAGPELSSAPLSAGPLELHVVELELEPHEPTSNCTGGPSSCPLPPTPPRQSGSVVAVSGPHGTKGEVVAPSGAAVLELEALGWSPGTSAVPTSSGSRAQAAEARANAMERGRGGLTTPEARAAPEGSSGSRRSSQVRSALVVDRPDQRLRRAGLGLEAALADVQHRSVGKHPVVLFGDPQGVVEQLDNALGQRPRVGLLGKFRELLISLAPEEEDEEDEEFEEDDET